MSFAEAWRFFQCLQYLTPGGRVIIQVQKPREPKMDVGGVSGIKQEQFLISVNGNGSFARLIAGSRKKAIRLGQQWVHGEIPLGIQRNSLPLLVALPNLHETQV